MIILTSSVASVAEHLQQNYLIDKNYKTILFIDTAAEIEVGKEPSDDDWLIADLESLRAQGYKVDRWSITNHTRVEIEEKIDSYDIIYMCGGNTVYLLQQLQETESLTLIKEKVGAGKPYIGTSAGSIIAGPKVPVYLEDTAGIELSDHTGFCFTNTIIVPHWGSPYFKEMYLEEGLKLAYTETEPPFLLLNDHQYVVLTNDMFRIEFMT